MTGVLHRTIKSKRNSQKVQGIQNDIEQLHHLVSEHYVSDLQFECRRSCCICRPVGKRQEARAWDLQVCRWEQVQRPVGQ